MKMQLITHVKEVWMRKGANRDDKRKRERER